MSKIKIIFNNTIESYLPEEISNDNLNTLCFFLLDDVGSSAYVYKEHLNDPWSGSTSSNFSYLDKFDENVVIGCLMDWGKPDEEIFETTIDELNYILDRWQELSSQKVKEIIITRDDSGKINIEGKK